MGLSPGATARRTANYSTDFRHRCALSSAGCWNGSFTTFAAARRPACCWKDPLQQRSHAACPLPLSAAVLLTCRDSMRCRCGVLPTRLRRTWRSPSPPFLRGRTCGAAKAWNAARRTPTDACTGGITRAARLRALAAGATLYAARLHHTCCRLTTRRSPPISSLHRRGTPGVATAGHLPSCAGQQFCIAARLPHLSSEKAGTATRRENFSACLGILGGGVSVTALLLQGGRLFAATGSGGGCLISLLPLPAVPSLSASSSIVRGI